MKSMAHSAIAVTPIRSDMEHYTYHYDDMDKDSRPPACYQLTYRGVTDWSCCRIHLDEYFEQLLTVQPVFNRRG